MFALVDCNNFYASCERVFRPDLREKPVVVLSNNDGCIISMSKEARALGIEPMSPAYQYEQLFRERGVAVFSSNYPLYGDMSARVNDILNRFSPEVEMYSIDESFLHYDGCEHMDLQALGEEIRKTVTQYTGIPVCVGFGPTKTLAKAANRIAKKFQERLGGVHVIDTDEKRIKALKWMTVESVWGIGYRTAKKLKAHGYQTAWDFVTKTTDEWVSGNMSVTGLRLKYELMGVPMLEKEEHGPRKNIAVTRSFEKNYTDPEDIKERVITFANACSEKLRKQNMHCNALMVFLLTNRHRKDLGQYNPSMVVRLPFPTNSTIEIAHYATEGFNRIFRPGYQYKKAGVVIMEFTPEEGNQLNMFENSDPKHKPLMQVIDKVNRSLGEQKIKLAGQDLKRAWKMKQEHLSPRYTTRINEIITVRV